MDYNGFFEEIKKFKKKQNKQKQRGLNDYNLLTTVLEAHDEIRLHSRMIGSLLNSDGLHYQGTLFLEKFLDILMLNDFDMDLENIYVGVEYHDIDLYITDGTKHIIIENKIWAEDQPCQIIKYINIIKEEQKLNVDENNIIADMRVIYLTPQNKAVSSEHLIENNYISFAGSDDKLKECSKRDNTKILVPDGLKNYSVLFKKIGYKKEILSWLNECLNEIQNITNLNEAIRQYIDVVKIINGNYQGKVMTLEDELLKDKEKLNLAKEVSEAYIKAIAKKQNKERAYFIDNLLSKISTLNINIEEPTHDYKNQWHCLDIKDKFLIRIFQNDNGAIVQVKDIKKRSLELNDLQQINGGFHSWKEGFELNINNDNMEQFDFCILVKRILKK